MLSVARETGVRMQLSHLMFAGTRSHKTIYGALARIDKAIKDGLDVKTDTYSYHCGQSKINVVLPPWFLAKAPAAFKDKKMRDKLKSELNTIQTFLGFGYNDIQITYANDAEFNKYNGMFLGQIAKARGTDWFESAMDIAERSSGTAAVLNHCYSNMEIIEALMKHPAVLFMTDSLPSKEGVQNPASSGCFPLFLQYARDKKLISLEETVYKMSGASAERFHIKDRGFLKEGLAADITVFNWSAVKDNNTVTETSNAPSGIEAVFVNGTRVLEKGKVDPSIQRGAVVV
jgi:N-acyl-D-amino-acid deacylase